VEGRTPELLERLAAGDADVVVVSAAQAHPIDRTRFTLYHLCDEELVVAVPRDHPLARRRVVRLAELAEDPFIVGSATAEEALMRADFPSGFHPRIDIIAADWTGKIGCVAAGLGVALLPRLAISTVPPGIALIRPHASDASRRRIFAAVVKGRSEPPAVTGFVPHLQDVARRL
jgi:DNA-binding transcriptional LysR family regulator